MPTMEGLVRPFQTTVDPVRVTEANQVSSPIVRFAVGRGGGGAQFAGSYSTMRAFYQDKAMNELSLPSSGMSPEMRAWAQHALAAAGAI